MLRRALCAVIALIGLLPAIAVAQSATDSLARNLPADKTVFYAEVDLKGTLDEGRKFLTFVDPEAGGKIVFQVEELYGLLRELAAGYEFQPKLFDNIKQAQLYFLIMAMDEPQVTEREYQVPKLNPDTWQPIPGEFDKRTYTERKDYVSSVVVTAPDEETAADFIAQFKAMLDREREKHPDSPGFQRMDIEVERGELFRDAEGTETLGRLGRHIIFSDGNPKELWAALMAPSPNTLFDTPVYSRLATGDQKRQAFMIVNIEALVRKGEESLQRSLKEAEEKYTPGQTNEEGGDEQKSEGQWELQAAKSAYNMFRIFKELFSLDQCRQAGAGWYLSAGEDKVLTDFKGLFAHGESISRVLEELLTGSGSFTPPRTGKLEAMCIAGRVSPSNIYNAVLEVLGTAEPTTAAQFGMTMQTMKTSVGVTLGEIFSLLAGDFYVYLDFVEKEVDVLKYPIDDKTGPLTPTTEKQKRLLPDVTLLWGVSDPEAARNTMSGILTALSTRPDANQFVSKRTYQETDVFCMGMNVANPDVYPDGLTSVAVTIVDRYVTFGSWEHVTALIRQMAATDTQVDPELQAILAQHADSNLLVVVPQAWQEKFRKLMEKTQGDQKDVFDKMLEKLESADFKLEDEALTQRLKTGLKELLLAVRAFNEKATGMTKTWVLSGTHKGTFYEIEGKSELSK